MMKRPDNTEMDRLLRRYARPGGEAMRAGLEQKDDDSGADEAPAHLDTDELNAYAEGALPEATRSRYFAHLADCDTCRKLVTNLTLAASPVNEGKTRVGASATSTEKSWRNWLTTIFSPPVLRYGLPALALFAIIVVAFVATRTQREASFVAQNDKAERSIAQPETSNSSGMNTTTAENHSDNKAIVPAEQVAQQAQPTQPAASPVKTAPEESASSNVSQTDVIKPLPSASTSANGNTPGLEGSRQVEEVASAPAPSPPAKAADTAEANKRERRDDQPKAKVTVKDDESVVVGGTLAAKTESNEARPERGRATASRSIQNTPTARKSSDAPKSEPASVAVEKERPAETRSVGGRKFRRQGGSWVDIAYKSSLPTVSVARGSEQYRALVADEPGLRTITQQLGGEVFVVWKHRAYRFY